MRLLRRHLRRLSGRSKPYQPLPEMEEVYRDLLMRDLATLGETCDFRSGGEAPSYSLLYLIQRIAVELHPANVLDIGAGQNSLLWDVFRRHKQVGDVTTLEHDAGLGKSIAGRIGHEMLVTPLRPIRLGPVQTNSYDWPEVMRRGPFDAIVCDGPAGSARFSRYGIIAALDEHIPENFVLVLGDADRPGEQDTVGAIHDRLRQLGRTYSTSVVRAARSHAVFATGRSASICEN